MRNNVFLLLLTILVIKAELVTQVSIASTSTTVAVETPLSKGKSANGFPDDLIKPYKATYDGYYNNKKIGSASRQLTYHSNDTFVLTFSSKARLMLLEDNRTEKVTFKIVDGRILPIEQTISEKRPFKGERKGHFTINWEKGVEVGFFDDEKWEVKHSQAVLEQLSELLQARADLLNGEPSLSYDISKKGQIKTYHYNVIGEKQLEIGKKTYSTLKVERARENSSRTVQMWLDKENHYFPVRIRQLKGGKEQVDLRLKAFFSDELGLNK